MQERLTQFLKDSSGWERISTNIQGVFLLKLPNSKAGTWKESIAIEINPVNPSTGFPTKKRGIVIRSASELEQITHILANLKLSELAKKMDEVNPSDLKNKAKNNAGDSDIIEI
ncbi:MAG: hypothetical protein ACR2IS_16055 [Nitrososphaeraceae archaeon]